MNRQSLEDLTLKKLREWAKRCGLPPILTVNKRYYIGLRVGPGVELTFNWETKSKRKWDLQLKDGIKNKTRLNDLELIYADPKFFNKIEKFIKNVMQLRVENAVKLVKILEETPIFNPKEKVN